MYFIYYLINTKKEYYSKGFSDGLESRGRLPRDRFLCI
jgi:hypothetical protein